MSTKSRFLVYGLVDPRDGTVRYVGKSSNGLGRPKEHREDSQLAKESPKNDWIKELHSLGFDYEIEVLEYVDNPKSVDNERCWWWTRYSVTALNAAERWWVAFWKAYGSERLTNRSEGGDGVGNRSGHSPSEETREKIKKHWRTPEARVRASARTTALWTDPDYVAKMSKRSERLAGDNNPSKRPEVRAKKRAAMTTPEQLARLSNRMRGDANPSHIRRIAREGSV